VKFVLNAALPNSIVLAMDFESGEPPESMGAGLIAVNTTCVAVGTLAEQTGATEFVLTDQMEEVDQLEDMYVAYDGRLLCTSGEVSLVSALNEKLLTIPVKSKNVRVRVVVNDNTEPTRLAIVLG
jgi:hypothetical protein